MNNTTPSPTTLSEPELRPSTSPSPQSIIVPSAPPPQIVPSPTQPAETVLARDKLLNEIRWLKVQRALAVLGVLGTLTSFIFTNFGTLKLLLLRPSSLQIIIQDDFLKNLGRVEITNTVTSTKVFDGAARDIPERWDLTAGSYQLKVMLGQEVAYEKTLQVLDNKERVVTVETEALHSIRLLVASRRSFPSTGEALLLTVTSSGNGYLWIFELLQGKGAKPLYPLPDTPFESSFLHANQPFRFPTAEGAQLFAGTKPGKERLLFIVTSSRDEALARKITDRFSPSKATAEAIPENWGMFLFPYEVH